MFESVTGLQLDADALIRSYHSWKDGLLHSQTDTRNSSRFAGEMRVVLEQFRSYGAQANALIGRDGFAALEPKAKRDIIKIAEVCADAVAEMEDELHPDTHFAKQDHQVKLDLTSRSFVHDDFAARVRAHGRGDVHAAKAQTQ